MKKHIKYMHQIERQAEAGRSFSNFSGSVAAGTPGVINPLNRTLTIVITNATNATATWVFGGFDVFGDGASAGSDTGVSVVVNESSHAQVKRDSATNPFYITGAKVSVSSTAQFNNPWSLNTKSSTGKSESYIIQPTNWRNPANNQADLLIADPSQFSMTLNGFTWLSGSISVGVTMVITATLGARINTSAVLENKAPISVSPQPFPYAQAPIMIQGTNTGTGGVAQNVPLVSGSR